MRNRLVATRSFCFWTLAFCLPIAAAGAAQDFDPTRAKAGGLRELVGQHLTLYTDLPSSPSVDELPQVFDAAVPQWARYFCVDEARLADWRMRGFLIVDKERFRAVGAVPDSLPNFPHGYSAGFDLWLFDQPSDYYRRHLLLHEGTHGFMNTVLGGCGASWYMEGVAEFAGTHRWADGKLQLGVMPRSRDEVPYWGRIASIKADVAAGKVRRFGDLVNDSIRGFDDVGSYSWCWALATFLDGHPRYQARFRELQKSVTEPQFNAIARRLFADDLSQLNEEWLIFANELEYGADVGRAAIHFQLGRTLDPAGTKIGVAVDRGWQSSGVRLEAGKTYRLRASGRYRIGSSTVDGVTKSWPCEAGGITLRYYRGRPLGELLTAVEPDELPPGELPAMSKPTPIGLGVELKPTRSGTLYLRINESNADLADNSGALTVEIMSMSR